MLDSSRPTYSSTHNCIYSTSLSCFLVIGDFVAGKARSRNSNDESTSKFIGQIIDILSSNIVPQAETSSFDYLYWNGVLPRNYNLCLVQRWVLPDITLGT